ncbi:TMV resistance protein N-like [Pyrus ussuriensis x Pyrus communis]|uniref:ADP-ribosyl cyclase/cyclic ADP-ribose hydrolase n=1 Tax=Pyrus ussuriensis x Pyrus communis TaxID=2448454 RepID=A0A5N5HCG8_9ROSA|nr:TMV resistance protein N-like [Pyrus ussuriensis x Pyrus communis]
MIPQAGVSSSSSPTPLWTYDVFLSFRGTDTRTSFTDHLYAALTRKGIITFRDDEKLKKGSSIMELYNAVEESRCVIAILSSNYADSTWCMEELAKAVECRRVGQILVPVFYHVHPSELRNQTGNFGKAFCKLEERAVKGNLEKVRGWRAALVEVAGLSGFHLDGFESELIQTIVENISTKLNQTISSVFTDLVGMDSRVKEMLSDLEMGRNNVHIVGIWGMGGIGKTTIAHVVSERIRAQFEAYSFLANVREVSEKQGLVHLQKKLLSDILLESNVRMHNTHTGSSIIRERLQTKKVLIILDDVDRLDQLKALCDHSWFGQGSRIIITSRDKDVLVKGGVDRINQVKALTNNEALQLFNWKAFRSDQVGEDFFQLSKNFVKNAYGLPLAIEVSGSSLFRRSVEEWSSALLRLERKPVEMLFDVLKVSFDGLQEVEKKIFLDIACFFKGEDEYHIKRILESRYGHCPIIHFKVLTEKCLLTTFGGKLWMHDLIEQLGWEIVSREHPEAGKRSRLWLPKDIFPVLVHNRGTTSVQGVFLNFEKEQEIRVNDPFSEMKKLKYLKIWNGNFSGNTKYLSNELALLEWHECPLNSLPSGFESDKLVELKIHSSCIKQLWTGEKCWSRLTFIDMSDSQYLIKTPDFTGVPNLEILVLQGCARLVEVHPTIGGLRNLISLNMRNCKSVESLPPFKSLKSLKSLTLSACSRLKKFPEVEGNMKCLLRVYLDETAIEELPTSIQHLTSLTLLNLRDCKNLLSLPNTIQYLTSLKSLILAGCAKFDEIPENLNCVECLEELDISGTAIRESPSVVGMLNLKYLSFRGCRDLPSNSWHSLFNCWWCRKSYVPTSLLLLTSFSSLISLTELDLSYCNLIDGAIPQDFGDLISLRKLNLSGNNFVRLPESICQLSKLEYLNLSNCRRLQLLPELPLSVRHVNAEDCISLMCFQDKFKLWTSAVSGMTTVNSHNLLDCRSCSMSSVCAQIEIPEWFSNIVNGDSIAIPIPPNLKDNKKWMGVAAVFLVKGQPFVSNSESDTETSDYLYRFTLGTHEFRLEPYLLDWKESCTLVRSSSDDFLCFFYESHMRFPKTLNESSSIWALLEAINPCMEIQKCGIRLVYKQDVAGFIQTFMMCFGGGQHEMNLQEVDKATFESGWFNLDNKYIFRWYNFIFPELCSLHCVKISSLLR